MQLPTTTPFLLEILVLYVRSTNMHDLQLLDDDALALFTANNLELHDLALPLVVSLSVQYCGRD